MVKLGNQLFKKWGQISQKILLDVNKFIAELKFILGLYSSALDYYKISQQGEKKLKLN